MWRIMKAEIPNGPFAFIYEGLKYIIPLMAMAPFYAAAFIGELDQNPDMIQFFRLFFTSPVSVGLVNLLGAGLSLFCIRVFFRRGSYIHS